MKLSTVRLHNFLSHADTFVELNEARLVSLVGSNGAGKSATLDGVLYALYDAARGKTDDLVRLGANEMSVEITFDFDGQTYRAIRGRTMRAGGKSFLELQVRNGDAWTPLTGEDMRATQASIERLLHADTATFTSAVFLRQGQISQFVEASPAERKRVLASILSLEVYARAEARARELARDVEARTSLERTQVERLADAIAELDGAERVRDEAITARDKAAADVTADEERRAAVDARLLELAAELAAGAAAEADVTRLEGERSSLADRYRREQKAITDAAAAADVARATLASADDVDQAVEALPALRLEVEQLERVKAVDDALVTQHRAKLDEIAALERPYERDHAAWTTGHEAAAAKVAELVEHGKAGTSVCQACGQAIEQKTALEQLASARATLKELGDAEPKKPLAIDLGAAAIARIESKQRELDWEPSILLEARRQLSEVERAAARGEAIAAARAALETAKAAAADATAELARITTAGEALAQQLAEAKAKVAGLADLRMQEARARAELGAIRARIVTFEDRRRAAERMLATAEANLERRDQLQAERDQVAASLQDAAADLAILRQLVSAFGVTGIPARIIESVIPELEGYANELLAELRPGMELSIRAQRAKKDGKGLIEALDLIVRDAAGERPLGLFSGGERMSVSLAIAVALSRLVARRAGAAIRSLVVDEPDGLDADARRAFGQALRVLAHHGELERVVLVSHHEDLAEFGDATYRVTKNGHGSVVEQVA